MNYYIGDLHLGHANCIQFDNRPFSSLDEMHQTILNNWNQTVSENDDVYILGDFAWKNDVGLEIARQLKGSKHLILGNHDKLTKELSNQFVTIDLIKTIQDQNKSVVLCHYPIAHWQNADHGYIHFYAHIHTSRDSRPFEQYKQIMKNSLRTYECYNVGCMLHNYTPVTMFQVMSRHY